MQPAPGSRVGTGVGTICSDKVLREWRERLEPFASDPPRELLYEGDPPDSTVQWVRAELAVEIKDTAWSCAGRARQPDYVGIREDKPPSEMVRPRVTL